MNVENMKAPGSLKTTFYSLLGVSHMVRAPLVAQADLRTLSTPFWEFLGKDG